MEHSKFHKWFPWVIAACCFAMALGLGALYVTWHSQYQILEQQADLSAIERRQDALRLESENIVNKQEILDLRGSSEPAETIQLAISRDGAVSVNGAASDPANIVQALQAASAGKPVSVVVSADDGATVKMLQDAMAACRRAGLDRFVIRNR